MRGHQPLLAMRRAGVVPHSTWLHTDQIPRDWTSHWPEDSWHGQVAANLAIDPDDNPATLDLRLLVGLPMVFVHGVDPNRVQAVFDAAVNAKPARVIAMSSAWIIDSTGALAWQA